MFPYYLLIFFPMLIMLVRSKGSIRVGDGMVRDERNIEIVVFFLLFMAMLMFRSEACGVDTKRYQRVFTYLGSRDWSNMFSYNNGNEVGYSILNKLIFRVSSDPQAMMIVTSFLAVFPLLNFYRKEAESPALTIVLFVTVAPFVMYFSGIKQSIAMGFVFPAWYCAKNKKPVWFLAMVALAMQFHLSAFVILAIYPLYHLRITPRWLWAVVPLMILVYIYNVPIFNELSKLLWDDFGVAENTGATTVLMLLILFAVYAFLIPDEEQMDGDMTGMRNLLLLAIVIQCFAPIHSLAMRMNYYFLLFIPILIPKVANRSKQQYQSVANLSVVVMTLFFLGYYFLRAHTGSDILQTYPYIPFWE